MYSWIRRCVDFIIVHTAATLTKGNHKSYKQTLLFSVSFLNTAILINYKFFLMPYYLFFLKNKAEFEKCVCSSTNICTCALFCRNILVFPNKKLCYLCYSYTKAKYCMQHLQKCFELGNYILTKFNAFIMMGKPCITYHKSSIIYQ